MIKEVSVSKLISAESISKKLTPRLRFKDSFVITANSANTVAIGNRTDQCSCTAQMNCD